MNFKSKKISLAILGITALVLSRILFMFFNDPEGPNLLVVAGVAVIIFLVSLATYLFNSSTKTPLADSKKLSAAIFSQAAITVVLYFCLK